MSGLYDEDILLWSEQQAELLRRHAAGAPAADSTIDWPNIIEEIQSVGREQLCAVVSLLRQALIHMLRAEAWPRARGASRWRADAFRLRIDAADRFAPSMRQRIDLDHIYQQARRALPDSIEGLPPWPMPEACPMTLDELLEEP